MPLDREIERELIHIRELLDARISANDQRHLANDEAQSEALRVALAALDKRLQQMNEFREAINDQANLMITRTESEAARRIIADKLESHVATLATKIDSEIKPLHARIEHIARPNWPLIASMLSLFMVMVAGIWLVIGLKIDATLSPVSLVVEQIKTSQARDLDRLRVLEESTASSLQADVGSKTDRTQLNERIRAAEQAISTNDGTQRAEAAAQHAKLVEVETQIASGDIMRNLMQSTNLRSIAMLWRKTFDETMPTDAYYPQIANRQPGQ